MTAPSYLCYTCSGRSEPDVRVGVNGVCVLYVYLYSACLVPELTVMDTRGCCNDCMTLPVPVQTVYDIVKGEGGPAR